MLNFAEKSPLYDPDPGAGGGGTQTPVTMEQVNAAVNAAVNGFATRFGGEQDKKFKGVTDQLGGIATVLEALKPKVDGGDGGDGGGKGKDKIDPALNAQLQALTNANKAQADRLAAMETENRENKALAEKAARHGEIRRVMSSKDVLGEHAYATPEAAEDFFTLVADQVTRGDDGSLVLDNLPLTDALKGRVAKKPWYLAAKNIGGSGAGGGGARGGGARVTLDDIKPGMTAEQRAKAQAEIAQALK